MAHVVLFHHVLGLTEGVVALADRLRAEGHVVDTPDLFDGRRFASIDDGVAHVDTLGFATLIERGEAAVAEHAPDVVYAGVSLGVVCAQYLAQTRPGGRGALLMEACLPATEFGDGWPAGMPIQIHGMNEDPFFAGEGDIDHARAIIAAATGRAELFEYPGDRHLFVDWSLPSYDRAAADLVVDRLVVFLADLDVEGQAVP